MGAEPCRSTSTAGQSFHAELHYMCRACERTFNALTGTPLAHLQKREKWLEYARAIVDGLSLRKAAKRVGVHLETSFRWRHRFLATTKGAKATA